MSVSVFEEKNNGDTTVKRANDSPGDIPQPGERLLNNAFRGECRVWRSWKLTMLKSQEKSCSYGRME